MIKWWVRTLILLGAFILSVAISFSLANQAFDDRMIVLGAPTLPRISFQVAGETINHTFGYVNEMELTSMRRTITPISTTGNLIVNLELNNNHIIAVGYEVFTLDGRRLLQEGNPQTTEEQTIELRLGGVFGKEAQGEGDTVELDSAAIDAGSGAPMREAVLRITLFTEERAVYFYTRIIPEEDLHIRELLNFARTFHQNTFMEVAATDVSRFLEWGTSSLNNGVQSVTLQSELSQIQWGGLAPQIRGEVEWSVYETNPSYTSILATYQVVSNQLESGSGIFNVREFFRARYVVEDGDIIFQKYYRTMNQLFTGTEAINEEGIYLGIGPRGERIMANEEETVVAFVQERELWVYSKARNQLAMVFSFTEDQREDRRSLNDQHNIRIIEVDEFGNTTFAVYGYMNRGAHEGMVGVSVFYYSMETNSVEEKAFISSNQAFGRNLDDAGNRVQYSAKQGIVYFITGGTLYEIDTTTNQQTIIFEGLQSDQYVFSDNGNFLAWQFDGERNSATTLRVKDLRTGETHSIFSTGGTFIRPLGFINDDFIYGFLREEDNGRTTTGQTVLPAYRLEIADVYREVVKNYQRDVFIESVEVEGNQIILNLLNEINGVYHPIDQYIIFYTYEEAEPTIFLRNARGAVFAGTLEIRFTEGTSGDRPILLRPQKVLVESPPRAYLRERPIGDEFYVYALGRLQGAFGSASDAVMLADELFGVVLTNTGNYVWERGNRFLQFNTHTEEFSISPGEDPRQALESYMRNKNARKIDFTGVNLLQMLYVINRGYPVICVFDDNTAVLITAFTLDMVTYMNPRTGESYIRHFNEVNERARNGGNVFIGFIPE